MKRKIDTDDVFVIAGGIMAAAGIWFIYWPAALIVVGAALLYMGIRGSRIRRH